MLYAVGIHSLALLFAVTNISERQSHELVEEHAAAFQTFGQIAARAGGHRREITMGSPASLNSEIDQQEVHYRQGKQTAVETVQPASVTG